MSPAALPAPCQSNSYSTTLSVSGGAPPFAWRVVAAHGQWQVNADPTGSKAQLTGQPAGPTSLTVEATAVDGRVVSSTFDVKPRNSCWFAYTALEGAVPRLQLLDPILGALPAVAPAHNDGVYDFQFSPNGRYLAYRFGRGHRLPEGQAPLDREPDELDGKTAEPRGRRRDCVLLVEGLERPGSRIHERQCGLPRGVQAEPEQRARVPCRGRDAHRDASSGGFASVLGWRLLPGIPRDGPTGPRGERDPQSLSTTNTVLLQPE